MAEIIYRGLVISSQSSKYYQVIEGEVDSIEEDSMKSLLTLTYIPGSTSESLSTSLGIPRVGSNLDMLSMGLPKKFKDVFVILNGLKFKKLTYDQHTLYIVIVNDSESKVSQDYYHTTIVVSENDYKDRDFMNFIFYSGNLQYLKPIDPIKTVPKGYELRNFPKFVLPGVNREPSKTLEPIILNSTSEVVYSLRNKYNDYLIRAIDYQDQFKSELRKILDEYGIELVRINKEQPLSKTSYISYQFSQTPVKSNHPKYHDRENKIMQHKQVIDFYLRTPDMVLYFDFKNKYNNVDLLTNFCEFKTTDKYGERWTAAIKWGQVTEDFNHVYQQDDNSNFSHQCSFRCELFFYEVFDDSYQFLQEILLNIEHQDLDGTVQITDTQIID